MTSLKVGRTVFSYTEIWMQIVLKKYGIIVKIMDYVTQKIITPLQGYSIIIHCC